MLSAGGILGCGILGKGNLSPLEDLKPPADPKAIDYVVHGGDVLDVQVWGEPRLSGQVAVREDGRFTLPLINEINAEGKMTKLVAQEITDKLAEFIPGASVSVSVLATAPIRYFLQGMFMKPGEYRSDKQITFLQAVATGGGFAPFANESAMILIRRTPQGELRYELDYNRVVDGKEPNPELKNGDVIVIK